ncbi:unnamed protein product, partial [Effrenium voratum]
RPSAISQGAEVQDVSESHYVRMVPQHSLGEVQQLRLVLVRTQGHPQDGGES